MPPSPGKIHSLPVKVLYSIDTTPHSYLTVLHDRQEVYVHPGQPGYSRNNGLSLPIANRGDMDEGPVGSCSLKAVARGICFASPECVPNTTNLDFSVYNLDPLARRPSARAFPSSPGDSPSSWTGRGFLSWILSEQGNGSTLIKGRMVREYEFSSSHFAPEGGLEGLMAAAQASANGGNSEDADGKGWGLEVGISLRQLNPEGKVEFAGRREFEEMLAKGKSQSQSVAASSPLRPGQASTPASIPRSSPHIGAGALRYNGAGTPPVSGPPQAGPSASSTATVRPSQPIAQPSPLHASASIGPRTQGPISRPSSALSHRPSSSSMPPSSLPALPSSSNSNMPSSRPPSSTGENRSSAPLKSEPPSIPSSSSQIAESSKAASQRNREVTPPPLPRPKSPPPSTPSRAKLHALLRADGMMSPDLARHLASNPVLRNLLKAVPSSSNALATLRNVSGINNLPANGDKGKKPFGSGDDEEDKDGSPERETTPTPIAPPQPTPRSVRNTKDGCCNCGTMVSSCWRTKKMKDGTPRKVCDDCGLYFNEHKRMRPPELWGQSHKPVASGSGTSTASNNEPKRKLPHDPFADGPAHGLRSSPRLNRTNSDKDTHHPSVLHSGPAPPESPRKRQKTKAAPPPSPRMATRASSKVDPSGNAPSGSVGASMDFSAEAFGFSPNTIFGTSPAVPQDLSNGSSNIQSIGSAMTTITGTNSVSNGNTAVNGGVVNDPNNPLNVGAGADDLDLTAFLNQMETSTEGFSLDSLFTGLGEGAGVELSQEMMDLIAAWDHHAGAEGVMGDHSGGGAAGT
ncbi:hypothetical protein I317_07925 [Kwoniella heveanensis CBS 569]|nr:hypothetical protein I317_07925 [Kwoniella heveanensis CBS 569]